MPLLRARRGPSVAARAAFGAHVVAPWGSHRRLPDAAELRSCQIRLDVATGGTKRRIEDVASSSHLQPAIILRDEEIYWRIGRLVRGWSIATGAELPKDTRPPAPRLILEKGYDEKGYEGWLLVGPGVARPVQFPKQFKTLDKSLAFHNSADLLLDVDRKLVRWSPSTSAITATHIPPAGAKYLSASAIAINADDSRVAFYSHGTITILDGKNLQKLSELQVARSYPTALAFDPTSRFLLEGQSDGGVELHSLEKGTSVTWLSDGEDWIAFDKEGTFHASPGGGRLVAAVKGFDAYRVDQLAIKLNRPDKLYERLALETPERIERLRKRHERRLAQLGLREADVDRALLNGPNARITSFVQTEGFVDFEVMLEDAEGLASYEVFVNDVPLYAPARKVSGTRQTVKERIELGAGTNVIEVSATDTAGLESFRAYRSITWSGKAPRALYFVGIGVSKYTNPDLQLEFAHKDALDLGDVLRSAGAPFEKVHVRTLLDHEVSTEGLREARTWLAGASPHDTVIVLITGHGAYDDNGVYYYLLPGTDASRLRETAASFEILEGIIGGIAARKKLLLLDTCESGELESGASSGVATVAGARARSARGVTRTKLSGRPSSKAVFSEERSFLTNDLRRRTGAVVVSASRGDEASWERGDIQNGVFTQALLEALTGAEADADHNGAVSTTELLGFVNARVAGFTDDYQHPTIDRDNRLASIELPLIASARDIVDRKLALAAPAPAPPTVAPGGCTCAAAGTDGAAGGSVHALVALVVIALARLRRRPPCQRARSSVFPPKEGEAGFSRGMKFTVPCIAAGCAPGHRGRRRRAGRDGGGALGPSPGQPVVNECRISAIG